MLRIYRTPTKCVRYVLRVPLLICIKARKSQNRTIQICAQKFGRSFKMSSRYLFYVSYLGTRFVGSQYQSNYLAVQNAFNNALALVLNVPCKLIKSTSSSRTDAGVHAMRNTYGLDMSQEFYRICKPRTEFNITAKQPYDPKELTLAMNYILNNFNVDARVIGGRVVSNGFCCRRHVKSRTYLYRLAVMKSEYDHQKDSNDILNEPSTFAPLIENHRCFFVGSKFNYNKFIDASKLFVGNHNFASFTMRNKEKYQSPMRHINYVGVDVGRPLIDAKHEPLSNCYNFIDITINSKAFLYRQIRKMVGAMIAVAQGHLSLEDIRWLLDNPDIQSWVKYNNIMDVAPAHGLYLQDIDYDPKDFDNPHPYYGIMDIGDDDVTAYNKDEVEIKADDILSIH